MRRIVHESVLKMPMHGTKEDEAFPYVAGLSRAMGPLARDLSLRERIHGRRVRVTVEVLDDRDTQVNPETSSPET